MSEVIVIDDSNLIPNLGPIGPNIHDVPDRPPGQMKTIQIPGVQDILVLPPLESESIKRERISRMIRTSSPIPHAIRWIPQLINYIDDWQDFIFVMLVIGKPILRRLPSAFLPYLGWALLFLDLLNIFNMFLSAPLTGSFGKRAFLRASKRALAGRKGRVTAAAAFLKPGATRWFPFALQAGQVLYSYTGWGLRLGGAMATLSDSFWTWMTDPTLSNTRLVPPVKDDLIWRAASLLSRSYILVRHWEMMQYRDLALAILGQNLANTLLMSVGLNKLDDERLHTWARTPIRAHEIWDPQSRAILEEMGCPTDEAMFVPSGTPSLPRTYGAECREGIAETPDVDVKMAEYCRSSINDFPLGQIANEAAQATWDAFGGGLDLLIPLTSPYERMCSIALETGIIPPFMTYPVHERWPKAPTANDGANFPNLPSPRPYTGPEWLSCFPREDQANVLHWTYPAAYPPPDLAPDKQILWWLTIALALYCGKFIWMPHYQWVGYEQRNDAANPEDPTYDPFAPGPITCAYRIIGWYRNGGPNGFQAPRNAAVLVWGNAYKLASVDWDDKPWDGKKKLTEKVCFRSYPGYYVMGTDYSDPPEWQALYEKLRDPDTPQDTDRTKKEYWEPPKGRDWLDQWLLANDPRRKQFGVAPFPPSKQL